MATPQDVERWRGRTLVDADGDKIGSIDDIYLDRQSGEPEWLAVKTGLLGKNVSFVPIRDAGPPNRGHSKSSGLTPRRRKSACQEGASFQRIGRALFGQRASKHTSARESSYPRGCFGSIATPRSYATARARSRFRIVRKYRGLLPEAAVRFAERVRDVHIRGKGKIVDTSTDALNRALEAADGENVDRDVTGPWRLGGPQPVQLLHPVACSPTGGDLKSARTTTSRIRASSARLTVAQRQRPRPRPCRCRSHRGTP
jgi:hypothetical protein